MDHSGNTLPSSTTTGDVNPLLSSFFDTSSFTQPLNPNPNPNPMYNLDTLWSKPLNSNPTSTHDPYSDPNSVDDPNSNFGPEKVNVTKNPKKRTRASRRAPTTVLTTNTTNFRQMVQEFTGIPAAPFTSSVYSSRLGLYSGSAAPMQPVRPSAQKIIQLQTQVQQTPPSYLNITPYESHGFTKQPLNLSNLSSLGNLGYRMFPLQSGSQTFPMSVTQEVIPRSEPLSGVMSSLKRWRGQDENLVNSEGVNGNYENDVVGSGEGDQHQLPGNEDSWSF